MEYIAYMHKDKGTDFGVSFPDFPGCVTAGATLQEAQEMAKEALALHIEGMMEDGEVIPQPSTMDDLIVDPDLQGGVMVLIPAPIFKMARVNISVREDKLAEIDRRADRLGMDRSAYMVSRSLTGPSDPARITTQEAGSSVVAKGNARIIRRRSAGQFIETKGQGPEVRNKKQTFRD